MPSIKPVTCRYCLETKMRPVRGSRDAGAFCCRECAFASRSMVWRESAGIKRIGDNVRAQLAACKASQEKAEKARQLEARVQSDRIKMRECVCQDCSMPFIRRTHMGKRATRCYACNEAQERKWRRAAKSARRAKARESDCQSIDPIKVFERDRWKCHICGAKTKKTLRGTYEPLAPELEHIVSLAEGGSHTWGNVACSCRRCNSAKGSASFGQLGLNIAA